MGPVVTDSIPIVLRQREAAQDYGGVRGEGCLMND